jgi:hypothetical protein
MDFSPIDYLDEDACYIKLVERFHAGGVTCPRCRGAATPRCLPMPSRPYGGLPVRRLRPSLQGLHRDLPAGRSHRRLSQLLMILRGITQGTPTAQMARELACDRKELLSLRHRLHARAPIYLDRNSLNDDVVEADEMYQNARGKGIPQDGPWQPAAKACQPPEGHGTFDGYRPPITVLVTTRGRSGWRSTRGRAWPTWTTCSLARARGDGGEHRRVEWL